MDSGHVEVETANGIATVRFGHLKGNSLPGALLQNIADTIDAVAADAASRVLVLRSNEPGPFCAGASFDELRAIRDAETGREFFMGFARVILAMRRCPKLIVARVHGKAVGGGVGIAAAADYAIATLAASVKLSELAVGIGPFVVGPAIERKIGTGAFQALAIDATGWRDADWAERHGLFAQVVSDGAALDEAVAALAGQLARSNPDAMATLKQVFWEGTDDWPVRLEERAAMSGRLVLSTFTRNAIAAFAAR
ncbi:MAG TPA: enoyl-CoA hydratase/isomerase family protein [Gemmatimonadaceae bacterium]|jgi:methylglutaconyl-CoA hydratase|nr:enoyl-CoA hydratase/isomerase family protein [Gemmatimonadaceae bacterium]